MTEIRNLQRKWEVFSGKTVPDSKHRKTAHLKMWIKKNSEYCVDVDTEATQPLSPSSYQAVRRRPSQADPVQRLSHAREDLKQRPLETAPQKSASSCSWQRKPASQHVPPRHPDFLTVFSASCAVRPSKQNFNTEWEVQVERLSQKVE